MVFWKPSHEGILLELRIRPGSGAFRIETGERLTIFLKSPPEGGKANQELVAELGRVLGKEVRLLRGQTSRKKIVLAVGADEQTLTRLGSASAGNGSPTGSASRK